MMMKDDYEEDENDDDDDNDNDDDDDDDDDDNSDPVLSLLACDPDFLLRKFLFVITKKKTF